MNLKERKKKKCISVQEQGAQVRRTRRAVEGKSPISRENFLFH